MRLLILGEGPTDLGQVGPDGTLLAEGTLPILVRKLLADIAPQALDVRIKEISKIRRSPEGTRRMGRSQHGYVNKLCALLGLREGREANAIIAVVDRDGERYKDRIIELEKGREELLKEMKPCAVGIAIEIIEAWLLADEKALRIGLANPKISRQPDPETLSGRDESNDRHPRGRLRLLIDELLGTPTPKIDYPELYAQVARAIEIGVLEQRCTKGFAPFAQQVRGLITA